jgi:hypothetical protein
MVCRQSVSSNYLFSSEVWTPLPFHRMDQVISFWILEAFRKDKRKKEVD